MKKLQLEYTSNVKTKKEETMKSTWESMTEFVRGLFGRIRSLLRLGRSKPGSLVLQPDVASSDLDADPGEHPPDASIYHHWWKRRGEYPGDAYPNMRTRGSMRSGAWMWICHALAHGLDPAREDWTAVEEMFVASTLKASTKRSYRSHIRSWFAWCRRKLAE